MKTIDTAHRLEAPVEQLDLPAPKVQMLLEEWKEQVEAILKLSKEKNLDEQRVFEGEKNFRDLAALFGRTDKEIAEITKRDRIHKLWESVFYRVQTKASNDKRMSLAA